MNGPDFYRDNRSPDDRLRDAAQELREAENRLSAAQTKFNQAATEVANFKARGRPVPDVRNSFDYN